MRFLLPVLLAAVGAGAGVGAGLFLHTNPSERITINPCGPESEVTEAEGSTPSSENAGADFVKLNNQFIVPVVEDGKVASLIVMSLSLQVTSGGKALVFEREPKLRDVFLQVLFDHANAGGFHGVFTSSDKLRGLHEALLEIAQRTMGPIVTQVLIQDLVRQDL